MEQSFSPTKPTYAPFWVYLRSQLCTSLFRLLHHFALPHLPSLSRGRSVSPSIPDIEQGFRYSKMLIANDVSHEAKAMTTTVPCPLKLIFMTDFSPALLISLEGAPEDHFVNGEILLLFLSNA